MFCPVPKTMLLARADLVKLSGVILTCGNFPDKWTVASAVPLLKVNEPYNMYIYKSISLAHSVGNIKC